ncbi:ubiquitin carboxyl-terminal hydrolase 25-like isoform X3 [Argonauta hians]
MTVEQSSLQQQITQRSKEETALSQIKEVTGIEDPNVITKAIRACCNKDGKYKIEDVVTMLVQDSSEYHVSANPSLDSPSTQCNNPTDAKENQKDLTSEKQQQQQQQTTPQGGADGYETEEIRKAIAASLQDSTGMLGGQVTREEQDISRVLEASLAESKSGTKRKRSDLWFVDPLNPHLREREKWCPVGLKNVGNTCWFSALIQSLFHVNRFRHLLINFQPHPRSEFSASNSAETRSLRFTEELRNLFSLMIGSYRKYVDPSKAVEILKEGFRSHMGVSDSQQDVSEFQGKLLEWLEDAFRNSPSTESSGNFSSKDPKEQTNPMIELFYGGYTEIGNNKEDNSVFLQFNLNVNGVRDVHESLEQETTGGSQSYSEESPTKEIWFNKLPPIMTFMLTRYDYNKQLQRSEKLHSKLEFPQVLFMDRYMHINKTETKKRREDSKKLREQLQTLQAKLDTFINYGSGRKRVPLQDVLQYALEFAESKRGCDDSPDKDCSGLNDVEMVSPKPSTSTGGSCETLDQAPSHVNSPPVSPMLTIKVPNPAPKNISDSELQVLQDCLCRWRTEVENEVRELQENISILESQINGMYSDAGMQKYPYHLHAVLVHEGQTASGHYWAYIFDLKKQRWLKFNDITVSEATWEELEKESVGGYHNATAYCLIYIDHNRAHVNTDSDDPLSPLSQLPPYLQQLVTDDNLKFLKEIEDWDREQMKKMTASTTNTNTSNTPPPAAAAAAAAGVGEQDIIPASKSQNVSTQTQHHQQQLQQQQQHQQQQPHHQLQPQHSPALNQMQSFSKRMSPLPEVHAQLSFQHTIKALTAAMEGEVFVKNGANAALNEAIKKELERLKCVAETVNDVVPHQDPRLDHILVYLFDNKANYNVIKRVLLEQFSNLSILDRDSRAKKIRQEAFKCEEEIQQQSGSYESQEYMVWHQRYHQFRCVVHNFIKGVKLYHANNFQPALTFLRNAYLLNKHLHKGSLDGGKGFNMDLLRCYNRKCLLHLNLQTAKKFEEETDVTETLKLMHHDILSSISEFSDSDDPTDAKAIDSIRNQWCTVVGKDFNSYKSEKLQDFFSKLFEPSTAQRGVPDVASTQPSQLQDLASSYQQVIGLCEKHGFLRNRSSKPASRSKIFDEFNVDDDDDDDDDDDNEDNNDPQGSGDSRRHDDDDGDGIVTIASET